MIVRKFELFLLSESNPSVVIDRFSQGVTTLKDLARHPSWPRRTLVGRVEWGDIYWQRLAWPAFDKWASPSGRAKLECSDGGIKVAAAIELKTFCIVGWSIPALIALAFVYTGNVVPLLLVLLFGGAVMYQIEGLQRALENLLSRKEPTLEGSVERTQPSVKAAARKAAPDR